MRNPPSRLVVADTETTGISFDEHRIIEIGLVEVINRKPTGNVFRSFYNPERPIDDEATAIHGITDEMVKNKPLFHTTIKQIKDFIDGRPLVFHNAPFDVGHISNELKIADTSWGQVFPDIEIIDTMKIARRLYPGARHSMDALCDRLGINRSDRELHGALLDAKILTDLYLEMTAGQQGLELTSFSHANDNKSGDEDKNSLKGDFIVQSANKKELAIHAKFLENLNIDQSNHW